MTVKRERLLPSHDGDEIGVVALAWFPARDYAEALRRSPSLAEDWASCPHDEYCRTIGAKLREVAAVIPAPLAVAPLSLGEYTAWCESRGVDSEEPGSRSHYAAELAETARTIPCPPVPHDPCWCGSGRTYMHCCGGHETSFSSSS